MLPAKKTGLTVTALMIFILSFQCYIYSDNRIGTTVELTDKTVNITGQLEYLERPAWNETVEEIAAGKFSWEKAGKDYINFGYTSSTYWFRWTTASQSPETLNRLIEINYPHLQKVVLYYRNSKDVFSEQLTGDEMPFYVRPVKTRLFVFPVNIHHGPNTFYLKIKSDGTVKFQANIMSYKGYLERKETRDPFYWIYYGFFMMLVILYLLLFIRLRERHYLYISIFFLFLNLLQFQLNGFAFQYLWPDNVFWHNTSAYFIMSIVMIFLCLFMINFMGKEKQPGFFNKFSYFFIIGPGTVMGLLFFVSNISVLYTVIFTLWVLVAIVGIFGSALYSMIKGSRPARLFIYGFSLFFLSIFIYALMDFSYIPYNLLTEWSMQIGSAMLAFFMSYGIADDMKKRNDELKTREKLIRNQRDELQAAYEELEATNEELRATNEEYEAMNEELIEAQHELMESEARFRRFSDNAPDVLFRKDLKTFTYDFLSPAIEVMTGYPQEEFKKNPDLLNDLIHPDSRMIFEEERNKQKKMIIPDMYEFKVIHKNGSEKWLFQRNVVVKDSQGNSVALEGIVTDITSMKKAELQLRKSLQEKELLLREIHHRVKNNMQVITSLLNLQSGLVKDQADRDLFIESENRVKSMALVHQKIYQSGDLGKIDFKDYISELINDLFTIYSISPERIKTVIDVEGVYLGVDSAVPCALIINELITNAVKHAFPDEKSGNVEIRFSFKDGNYILEVKDNGIGMPDDILQSNTGSLGMELVQALTGQLKGTMEIINDHGTLFRITFPSADKE